MASGKLSPIVRAIGLAEKDTTAEIRVHLGKFFTEKDPYARAARIFREFQMDKTGSRNAVLLYVNLRRRKFALLADEGAFRKLGQAYFEELARSFRDDLYSTHYENAIAIAVRTLGFSLSEFYPREQV